MKHLIMFFLLVSFCFSNINAQVIFKPSGSNVRPLNPNGAPIGHSATAIVKPKPKSYPVLNNGIVIKPKPGVVIKPHVRPRPHPHSGPSGGNIWIPGHWYYNTEKHKKIWVEGYAMIVMDGGIYVQGHWIESAHGLHWIPAHWINRGYPIYK